MESQSRNVNSLVNEMRGLCQLLRRQQEQSNALREQARMVRARSQRVREVLSTGRFDLLVDCGQDSVS